MIGLWLYVVAFFVSWILVTGWVNAYLYNKNLAPEDRIEDLGMSIVIAFFVSFIPVFGAMAMYCVTGMAERGWRLI